MMLRVNTDKSSEAETIVRSGLAGMCRYGARMITGNRAIEDAARERRYFIVPFNTKLYDRLSARSAVSGHFQSKYRRGLVRSQPRFDSKQFEAASTTPGNVSTDSTSVGPLHNAGEPEKKHIRYGSTESP